MEVVLGEEPLALRLGRVLEFLGGVLPADWAGAWEIVDVLEAECTVWGEVSPVLCVEGVACGVEEVAAQRHGEAEHHRVTCAEEVERPIGGQVALRCHYHVDEDREHVALHDLGWAAEGMDLEGHRADSLCRLGD